MLEAFFGALATIYFYGRWAVHRSQRWQAAGLCAGCGAETPSTKVGGNNYCEACAPRARKNLEVGGLFFVFMGAGAAIGLSAMLLEGGLVQQDRFLDSKIQIGLAAIGAMAVAFWIHRKMKGKEVR